VTEAQVAEAVSHLRTCRRLGPLVERHEPPGPRRPGVDFAGLARIIVGQQLSGKAADAVWARFTASLGEVVPERAAALSIEELRAAGLSRQKAGYVADLAAKMLTSEFDPTRWPAMNEVDVTAEIVSVKGLGPWTADMVLMFSLGRPDVLPVGDLGIRKGIQRLLGAEALPDPETMRAVAEPWRPWRTVACHYLWRSLDAL
jgi:DNA-3-methyladenine glycosylase II